MKKLILALVPLMFLIVGCSSVQTNSSPKNSVHNPSSKPTSENEQIPNSILANTSLQTIKFSGSPRSGGYIQFASHKKLSEAEYFVDGKLVVKETYNQLNSVDTPQNNYGYFSLGVNTLMFTFNKSISNKDAQFVFISTDGKGHQQITTSKPFDVLKAVKPKPIPKFSFNIPNTYTSSVTSKVISVSATARVVLFNIDNSQSTDPTEQVYTVNSKTNKWQLTYTNTLTALQHEFLENAEMAELGPHTYVVESMWDAGTGGSMGYGEVVVVDTQKDKVIYEKDYQHNTLNSKLFTLNSNQVKPIIQQNSSSSTPIPEQSVAVLGATSGNILYLYNNKIQDVEFNNQTEIEQLTLPADGYVMITPSSDLTSIDEIQGNYINLTNGNYSQPTTLTVKAGTILVFNNISQYQYSAYTNMWNQGQVQEDEADMVSGGVTPELKVGLFKFFLAPNNTINQGVILQVHVTK